MNAFFEEFPDLFLPVATLPCDRCAGTGVFEGYEPEYNKPCIGCGGTGEIEA